ncbi:MAG: hypothetical protein ACLFN5_07685 [bacterium]
MAMNMGKVSKIFALCVAVFFVGFIIAYWFYSYPESVKDSSYSIGFWYWSSRLPENNSLARMESEIDEFYIFTGELEKYLNQKKDGEVPGWSSYR